MFLLQAVATQGVTHAGELAISAIVVSIRIMDYFLDKTRDHNAHSKIDGLSNKLDLQTAELRSYIIGPDGKNGLRGDIEEVKQRVGGLEKRELDTAKRRPRSPRRRDD